MVQPTALDVHDTTSGSLVGRAFLLYVCFSVYCPLLLCLKTLQVAVVRAHTRDTITYLVAGFSPIPAAVHLQHIQVPCCHCATCKAARPVFDHQRCSMAPGEANAGSLAGQSQAPHLLRKDSVQERGSASGGLARKSISQMLHLSKRQAVQYNVVLTELRVTDLPGLASTEPVVLLWMRGDSEMVTKATPPPPANGGMLFWRDWLQQVGDCHQGPCASSGGAVRSCVAKLPQGWQDPPFDCPRPPCRP